MKFGKRGKQVGRVSNTRVDRRVGVTAFKSIEGENEAHRAQRRLNHSMFIPQEYYATGKTERDYFKENLRYYMQEYESKKGLDIYEDDRLDREEEL